MDKKFAFCLVLLNSLILGPDSIKATVVTPNEHAQIVTKNQQIALALDNLAEDLKRAQTHDEVHKILQDIDQQKYNIPLITGIYVLTESGIMLASSEKFILDGSHLIFSQTPTGQYGVRDILNAVAQMPSEKVTHIPVFQGIGGPVLIRARIVKASNGVDYVLVAREIIRNSNYITNIYDINAK